MDNETDPNSHSFDGEPATDAPMHFKIEMRLITDEIVGKSIEENCMSAEWRDKREHVGGYLNDYHEKHGVLPAGCHDLGHTASLSLEIGVVDFDLIRQNIWAGSRRRAKLNYESPEEIEAFPDYPLHREIEMGLREQKLGRDPNEAIFNLRQKLIGRLDSFRKT